MSKRIGILIVALLSLQGIASAQIVNGLDTLYGMEWIVPGNQYLRLEVNEDGFYRINYADLQAEGWPVNTIQTEDYQLFHNGQLLALHPTVPTGGPLQAGEGLIFWGEKNDGQLDQHIYRNPDGQQLNPEYSLFSDVGVYYLTWQSGAGAQYTTLTNDLNDLPAAEPYIWREQQRVFTDHFMKEYYRFSGATLYYSHFSIGEGYGNRSINQLLADGDVSQEVELDLPQAYAGGPAANLKTRYVAALFEHIQRLSANDQVLRTDTFYNWEMQNVAMPLPQIVLQEEQLRLNWEGFGGPKDEVSVGFVSVDYPAVPNAEGAADLAFRLRNTGTRQYLELANVGASNPIIYDLNNQQRIPATSADGTLRVAFPAAEGERQIRMLPSEEGLPSPTIQSVDLQLPDLANADYIILTNSLLRAGSEDAVQAYADYRASAAGGGYRTAVVNVDELFDQFAYGVQQHPLGIRNFVAWQRKINPEFEFLFIVGKGREYKDIRTPQALEEALGSTLFVPSFGFPASDNLLVSRLDKPTPEVNIGRLPAINPAEVQLYLNKIRGMESFVASSPQTIDGRSWMKNVLHLGGGGNASEQQSIRNSLEAMANTVESGLFGGTVTGVYKSSADPIETSQSDFIFSRINAGVSMITFFGHASAGTFDFSIDNPDNYLNANKYPLMMSLGCYSGNMFADFRSIGERFIFLENGGAGTYAASRGLGFIHALNSFGRYFYDQMSGDLYGATVGEGLRTTIANFQHLTDQAYGSLNEQFTLHGDPAFRLNPAAGPDLVVDPSSVKFNPTVVTVQRDSFELIFDLYNLGIAEEGTVTLQIEQQLPSGERQMLVSTTVDVPHYQDQVKVNLPTLGRASVGVNRIFITIDPANDLAESPFPAGENNNNLVNTNGEEGVPLFVVDNTAVPIWPMEFGIVGNPNLVLKSSSSNVLTGERTYQIEIDDNADFQQPLAAKRISQLGGLIEWQPDVNWQDSTVYYWRISPIAEDGDTTLVWETSSFTFLDDVASGFSQAHADQWPAGEFVDLRLDESGNFEFRDILVSVRIKNKIWDSDDRPGLIYDNGGLAGSVRPWNYLDEGVAVVVSTPNTASFWRNPPDPDIFSAGEYGVPTGNSRVFAFPTTTVEERSNLMEFLEDVVPEDYLVFFFTIYDAEDADIRTDEWALDSLTTGTNLFQYLETQGAAEVRQLETFGTVPYIFKYQKNRMPLGEAFAPDILSEANLEISIPNTLQEGVYQSPVFGPATDWESLNYRLVGVEAADSMSCSIWAGSSPALLDSITTTTLSTTGTLDLTPFDLEAANYLRLQWEVADFEDRTSPNLDYWHLTAQLLPDIALDPARAFSFTGDTLAQGQNMNVQIAVHNSSPISVQDSFELRYSWVKENGEVLTESIQGVPLNPGDTYNWEVELLTAENSGPQQLILEANPLNQPAEAYRFNNNASFIFELTRDEIDPLVDITFDGVRILNGDLVSARPEVIIEIVDDNPLLLLDDPSLFTVQLIDPNGQSQSLGVGTDNLVFLGATDPEDNRARLVWQPELIVDGEYRLRINAKDRTGNTAGRLLAEKSFEVLNEQFLSNILPYPNPFTTSTQFVYTLSGTEELMDVRIQILTASGRIVREISSTELGPLKVGTHRTDYAWDGRDQYGDQLANGVYFYRVLSRNGEGEMIETFVDDRRDQFFQGGLGKIVLLR